MQVFDLFIVLPFVASVLAYLLGRLHVRRNAPGTNPAAWIALVGLLGDFGLWIQLYVQPASGPVGISLGTVTLHMDGLAALFTAAVLVLATCATLLSFQYIRSEENEEKFYALLLQLVGCMLGLATTSDLFNLWIWFEAMAISSYFLVPFHRTRQDALEAGVKYLLQSAIGSAFVLFGIALVFSQTGSLSFATLHTSAQPTPLLWAGGALLLVGFGVKAALVPLHTWLPDAHSQAPSGISAMLSGVVIEAGVVAILRSLTALGATTTVWGWVLMVFSAIGMLAGNLLALRQEQIKRMLAFSSIAHVGYMLAGFGLALALGSSQGAAGGFFHLFNHAIMKGLAFLCAGGLLFALRLGKGDESPLLVSDIDGAAQRYPLLSLFFSLALLSLGGLPLFAGFMSKWQIMVAGFQTQNGFGIALAVFAAFNSILSLAYYTPLVNRMYRHEASPLVQSGVALSSSSILPLGLLSALVLLLGLWPAVFSSISNSAASALLGLLGV